MTESAAAPNPPPTDLAAAERVKDAHARLKAELHRTIVGMDDVIDEVLISIFARGHCLLVGVPGLAKTLLVSSVAQCLSLSFNRIQFTPDLMPADITGTEVIQEDRATGARGFKFLKGPIFANVILADEINRTPPKTQAALLESMQERQVTAGGTKHELEAPFFVLATQNPIEQEGTYPLPEAQLDRFMFMIRVNYPSEDEEARIVETTTRPMTIEFDQVLSAKEILEIQDVVRRVPISEHVVRYVLHLVRATRVGTDDAIDVVKDRVAWGAGPRASQFLVLAAKARALLHGRLYVATEDVKAVAHPVLRHRMITTYGAEAEGWDTDRIIDHLLEQTPTGESETLRDEQLPNVLGS